jgi:hypothetical protein
MELNVNTVYTTVLSILNKEQRGYMTPDEFNKVATQVQLEIFEGFFEDLNQYLRMPKTSEEFASRIVHIEEEIQTFEEYKSASSSTNGDYAFPQDSNNKNEVYRLGSIYFNAVPGTPQIELVGRKEYKQQLMSPLTQPSKSFPIGILKNDKVEVFPKVTTFNPARTVDNADVKFSYVRKPKDVRWGFTTGSLGQYVYDSTEYNPPTYPSASDAATAGSTQFEIDASNQTTVILEILKYSGIIIRDPQIVQAAQQELIQDEANEKR